MPAIDLRFPGEVRAVLSDLGRMLSESAPAAMLQRTQAPQDDDPEFAESWLAGIHERVEEDVAAVIALFENPAFGEGPVELGDDEALAALRGFTVLRLTLRDTALREIDDEALETGRIDRRKLRIPQRHAYACYGALGEIQDALCHALL